MLKEVEGSYPPLPDRPTTGAADRDQETGHAKKAELYAKLAWRVVYMQINAYNASS
jgi:hypothetical protein